MTTCVSGALICLSASCTLGVFLGVPRDASRIDKPMKDYKKWTCINAKPFFIPEAAATLCRMALPSELPPHGGRYIRVYVNGIGRAEFAKEHPQFPVGTVIVKEKLKEERSKTPELMTVMVKREKGFDAANGDWEYAVTDGTGTAVDAHGKVAKCQGCHATKKDTDYVFRGYLTDKRMTRLGGAP